MSANGESFSDKMKRSLLTRNTGWTVPAISVSFKESAPEGVNSSYDDGTTLEGVELPSAGIGSDHYGVVWTDFKSRWLVKNTLNIDYSDTDTIALRTALLFSDIVDIPTNNILAFPQPTIDLLKPFNIVQSTRCLYNGTMSGSMRRYVSDAYLALAKRDVSRWTIARGAESPAIPASLLDTSDGFAILLTDALPVFDRSVSIEEVLEHKHKRRPELIALREGMAAVVQQVAENGTNNFLKSAAFKEFDKSLADHMKIMAESNAAKVMTSFRQSVSWDAAIPAACEFILNQTVMNAGILGGAATIGFNTIRGLRNRKGLSPFEYLTTVSRELY